MKFKYAGRITRGSTKKLKGEKAEMRREVIQGLLILGLTSVVADTSFATLPGSNYGNENIGGQSGRYEDDYVSKRQIRKAEKAIQFAEDIAYSINQLVRKIEDEIGQGRSGRRGNDRVGRRGNRGNRGQQGTRGPRRGSQRGSYGQYENDAFALVAIKTLPKLVIRGVEYMNEAVDAGLNGDYATFYDAERDACNQWIDAEISAREAKGILNLPGNSGAVWKSDFEDIAQDISYLISDSDVNRIDLTWQ